MMASSGYRTVDFAVSRLTIRLGMKPIARSDCKHSPYENFHKVELGEEYAQAHRCRIHQS
jgi:hypothetical protein